MADSDTSARTLALVVEDDPATRSVETIVPQDGGFVVLQAKNGEDGLRLAREHRPGVILLDLALPVMSGFDFLTALKSKAPTAKIPVVVVSAYADLVEDCAERSARRCVRKPFVIENLLSEVREALVDAKP